MPRHQFKPGEKEAVAAVLGIEPQMLPDDLELEPEDTDEDDDEVEVPEEDDEDEEDEDEEDEDEDEEDDEDKDAEESDEEVDILKLLTEWRRDKYSEYMLFSEFLKNRGK